MRRREFITGFAGVVATPFAVRAQERMRRVAVLMNLAADDPLYTSRLLAFGQGLQQAGWIVGTNLRIEVRSSEGDADRLQKIAAELVALAPDVILSPGSVMTAPLLQVTRTIPIVFVHVPDPVGAGFADSLARPGRKRHRLCPLGIQHQREMAGIAQTDRAEHDAGRDYS